MHLLTWPEVILHMCECVCMCVKGKKDEMGRGPFGII